MAPFLRLTLDRLQEAQLDVDDDVSSMCYVEVRNALIDEVHR